MRKTGALPSEQQAVRFGDFLYVQGIENDIEDGDDGHFDLWVHDDEQLDLAKKHLEAFRADPTAPQFDSATDADRKRAEEAKADARRKSRVISRERLDYERNFSGFAWLPMILAVLCVAGTIFAGTLDFLPRGFAGDPQDEEAGAIKRAEHFQLLQITKLRPPKFDTLSDFTQGLEVLQNPRRAMRLWVDHSLPEVRSGQVWRLITPIFIHGGLLHLLFNLMWLRDLGGFIQHRFGVRYLGLLVVLSAALSNYGQLLWDGPFFGGFSGVNYALFGFLWMRQKHDRFVVWTLSPVIIQSMMIWFGACIIGFIPNVANAAHAVGLLAGMAWGYVSGTRSRGV